MIALSTVLLPPAPLCNGPGLGSGAFARRYLRYHWFVFFSSGYLDVSVPRVRPAHCAVPESLPAGCPIRISTDLRIFAPPRGFSQLITSFLASESQGILHVPFSPFLLRFKESFVTDLTLSSLPIFSFELLSSLCELDSFLYSYFFSSRNDFSFSRFHNVNVRSSGE